MNLFWRIGVIIDDYCGKSFDAWFAYRRIIITIIIYINFSSFIYYLLQLICMQNFWFVSSAVPEILAGSQNLRSRSRDLGQARFFKIFHFYLTAWNASQTRSNDENSVRPSVCQSVTRVNCDETVERSVQIYIPYKRSFSLVFWEEEWLAGGDHIYLKFWVNRPPLERNRRFLTDIGPQLLSRNT